MKREKTTLGPLEMQLLAYTQLEKRDVIRTGELVPVLDISTKQERELLSRLARSGVIIRLKRGAYLVPPRMPAGGRWSVSAHFILAQLMAVLQGRYQVSGPSTFYHYGFTSQVPNRLYVYNDRICGERRIGGAEFVFIKTSAGRLGATETLETTDGVQTVMASKARTLVDAVYDWSRYNTIPRVYGWIAVELEKEPEFGAELVQVATRFGNRGTWRRLGYLLESCGLDERLLARLKRKLGSTRSLIPWVPERPARGTIYRDWGLIVNGTVPARQS
jgi:predicted transcriptional regulator of viral defense system